MKYKGKNMTNSYIIKKKIKQINNLVIYYSEAEDMYEVWTPCGRVFLEDFHYLHNAENFCKETKDFIKRK